MSILPVALRRRLRDSGFTEEQTDALDEASEATAEAAREGLAEEQQTESQYQALRRDNEQLRAEMQHGMQQLRTEMQAIKWWLFGALATLILAATAALIAAMVVWG